jgi:hypothetical protein
LTVTGANANKVYNGNTTAIITGATLTGVVGLDDVTLINDTSGTFASANVGSGISVTTTMDITGTDTANYTLVQPTLTANITKKALTVTATDKSKTYGDANPALTVTYNGFAGTDNADSLTTAPIATTAATQFSNATTYSIVPAGGVAANYTFSYINGTLTVNKAPLDITANDTSRKEGEQNPVFTLSCSGFKGTDNSAAIDVLPSATCTADSTSVAGDYDIVLAGGSDNNYILALHNGKLTITPATAISTVNDVSVSMYPNPAGDYIYIDNLPEETAIRIFNLLGKQVKKSISSNKTEKIDVNDLPLGVYIIKLSGKNIETVVRVVKQ